MINLRAPCNLQSHELYRTESLALTFCFQMKWKSFVFSSSFRLFPNASTIMMSALNNASFLRNAYDFYYISTFPFPIISGIMRTIYLCLWNVYFNIVFKIFCSIFNYCVHITFRFISFHFKTNKCCSIYSTHVIENVLFNTSIFAICVRYRLCIKSQSIIRWLRSKLTDVTIHMVMIWVKMHWATSRQRKRNISMSMLERTSCFKDITECWSSNILTLRSGRYVDRWDKKLIFATTTQRTMNNIYINSIIGKSALKFVIMLIIAVEFFWGKFPHTYSKMRGFESKTSPNFVVVFMNWA